ncbi:membrane-anchored ubiquitin-fold protein 1-like protein, partial [Tanacetum coccineum]
DSKGFKDYISAGNILENSRMVGEWGECKSALSDVPCGVATMHVVVSQPPQEKDKSYHSGVNGSKLPDLHKGSSDVHFERTVTSNIRINKNIL